MAANKSAARLRTASPNRKRRRLGVGDEVTYHVIDGPAGGTELHVDATQGMYKVALMHSSVAGATDVTQLKELMGKVLSRLG